MLCINSSNSFSKFCSHLNKLQRHPAHSIKKKKSKKNKTSENSKVLLLLWYLAPFFFKLHWSFLEMIFFGMSSRLEIERLKQDTHQGVWPIATQHAFIESESESESGSGSVNHLLVILDVKLSNTQHSQLPWCMPPRTTCHSVYKHFSCLEATYYHNSLLSALLRNYCLILRYQRPYCNKPNAQLFA